jgi:hypothetical protein
MKRLSLLIALLAVLASGCRADVRLLLNVAEDGSGELAVEVGVDDELDGLITQFFGPSEEVLPSLDLGVEGEKATRSEAGLTVYSTTVAFSETSEIAPAAADNFTDFSLEVTDSGASLEATLDITGELDPSQFPVDPEAITRETLSATMVVSLPGEPVDHNADGVLGDGRLSWNVPLDSSLYMFANTEYPSAPFPWWLVALLIVSVGFALVVWFAAARRDRQSDSQRRAAPEPPPITPPNAPEAESPFFDMD